MQRNLLIINQEQFGYHTDYFEYCRYLRFDFDITYLCWEYVGRDKIIEDAVNIIYVSRSGNILVRNLRFINTIIKLLKVNSYSFVMIHYFKGCSIIPLLFNNNFNIHLDIRTSCISLNVIERNVLNLLLRFESLFFNSISIISEGLKQLLKLPSKSLILPLGANSMIVERKLNYKISMLYVGILTYRHIEDTIIGLGLFLNKYPSADIHYIIIGTGWESTIEQIREKILEYKLDKYVELKGYVPYKELTQYFEKSNVGVSYIPITPWFEYQPATKTYEYLMAGIPVIATGTFENKKIINEINGIIINDDPFSFANSLTMLQDKIDSYKENLIRDSVADNKWETIIPNLKMTILNKIDG